METYIFLCHAITSCNLTASSDNMHGFIFYLNILAVLLNTEGVL